MVVRVFRHPPLVLQNKLAVLVEIHFMEVEEKVALVQQLLDLLAIVMAEAAAEAADLVMEQHLVVLVQQA